MRPHWVDIVKLIENYEMQNELSDAVVEALAKVFPLYWKLSEGVSEQQLKGHARRASKYVQIGNSQMALESYLGRDIQTNTLG